jgi:hypothetical protein
VTEPTDGLADLERYSKDGEANFSNKHSFVPVFSQLTKCYTLFISFIISL